ncbi:MAG: hypothetical protein PHV21_06175, partial [Synergistaceae bacterium]|nr:hypothetical protein [Synergistaceae bacterium]
MKVTKYYNLASHLEETLKKRNILPFSLSALAIDYFNCIFVCILFFGFSAALRRTEAQQHAELNSGGDRIFLKEIPCYNSSGPEHSGRENHNDRDTNCISRGRNG